MSEAKITKTQLANISVEDAINYCHRHRNEFLSDAYGGSGEGIEQFDCLISLLENKTIEPSHLPEYGMDYPDDVLAKAIEYANNEGEICYMIEKGGKWSFETNTGVVERLIDLDGAVVVEMIRPGQHEICEDAN